METPALIPRPERTLTILRHLGLETIASYHAETTGIMEDSDLRNARVWRFAPP